MNTRSTGSIVTIAVVLPAVLLTVLFPAQSVAAQSGPEQFEIRSDHYSVISEVDRDHASAVTRKLEAMLQLYNGQFRFPLEERSEPFRVRIFVSKERYDAYLAKVINETRQGYVYLHYRDPAKSELVGYYLPGGGLDQSLLHQSFVQFLRGFIHNPPLWLREGFAVYYEASEYDREIERPVYRENLAWLETLKEILSGNSSAAVIPFEEILSMTQDEARSQLDVFYPQAWGMVSFLVNAEYGDANRMLWDSISALQGNATLEENVQAVYEKAFRWVNREELFQEFLEYIDSRRNYQGWITDGVEAFNDNRTEAAERAFVQAIQLNEDNYVPYYYLGLINYERSNYGLAEYYYQEAAARGADKAITLYALGLNAYGDNRFEDAQSYLEETVQVDPSYAERAEVILARIR